MERNRVAARLGLLGAAAMLAAVLSLCLGPVPLTPVQLWQGLWGQGDGASILAFVRLPRTVGCVLAGAALAVSGGIIQTVLANPLAAPSTIGVNSGAGLGVALCSALLPGALTAVPFAAFLGAFIGVLFILLLAERAGASRITLVLAGVALSSMFSAGVDAVGAVILACVLLAMLLASEMDLLALGSDTARSLGLRVRPVRTVLLALAAALAGAAVSFAGLLGFVGLIVPHIVRRLLGGGSLRLVAGCALCGAALLTLCDLLSRLVFAPFELPVGIVLSLAGGPFFLWLLFVFWCICGCC